MISFNQLKTGRIIRDGSFGHFFVFVIVGSKISSTCFEAKEYSFHWSSKSLQIKNIHFDEKFGFSGSHEFIDGRHQKSIIRRLFK